MRTQGGRPMDLHAADVGVAGSGEHPQPAG